DTELSASILFLQQRPPSDAAGQQALVDAILAFNARHDEQRMMIWAPSASSCTSPEFSPPYTALLRDGEAKMYIGHT
ncbi:hypothetical protein NL463_31000, partial [Klebsiella pneumoniae]|nr:hypothetical protein [Klebsiella pneumoniae]